MSEFINRTAHDAAAGDAFDVLFGVIVILLAGFSGYQTYVGFSYDYHFILALAIAITIGLSLLLLNLALRRAIKDKHSKKGVLLMFVPIVIISFISNTNAFYSASIAKDIVGTTQEEAWRVYDEGTHQILVEIDKSPAVIEIASKMSQLEIARTNLLRQITDERNPGLGQKAKAHLERVEQILGVSLTSLKPPPPGSSMQEFEKYASRLDGLIEEQSNVQLSTQEVRDLAKLKNDIQATRNVYNELTRSQEYDKKYTDRMARDLEGIRGRATDLLNRSFELESVNNTADEFGAFNYTFRNFMNWVHPTSIVLSCIIALLLDLIPPGFALGLLRPTDRY